MNLRDELNLAFIYMGVLMGAGFASGREIMNFFTVYGERGLWGIVLAWGLFFVTGYVVFKQSLERQSTTIREVLSPYAGGTLVTWFEGITLCFLLAGYYIMLAGCGAVLWEFIKIPYMPATAVLSFLSTLWLSRGSKGLSNFNGVLVPLMIALTLLICALSLRGVLTLVQLEFPPRVSGSWFISSVLYVSFNTTLISVVIASLGNYTPRVSAAFGAALMASLGFLVVAVMLWLATSLEFPELSGVEVPLLFMASRLGRGYYWGAVLVLLSAMLTTALGLGYAFAQGIHARFQLPYAFALGALFIGWPFTAFGFSKMIDTLYPLFGVIGIIFVFLIIIRRFFCFKRE